MLDPIRQIWNLLYTYWPDNTTIDPQRSEIDFIYREPTTESMKPSISIMRVQDRLLNETLLDTTSMPSKGVEDNLEVMVAVPGAKTEQDTDVIDKRWTMIEKVQAIIRDHMTDLENIHEMELRNWRHEGFTSKYPNSLRSRARLICKYEY